LVALLEPLPSDERDARASACWITLMPTSAMASVKVSATR
jgi:hypothetical protein